MKSGRKVGFRFPAKASSGSLVSVFRDERLPRREPVSSGPLATRTTLPISRRVNAESSPRPRGAGRGTGSSFSPLRATRDTFREFEKFSTAAKGILFENAFEKDPSTSRFDSFPVEKGGRRVSFGKIGKRSNEFPLASFLGETRNPFLSEFSRYSFTERSGLRSRTRERRFDP